MAVKKTLAKKKVVKKTTKKATKVTNAKASKQSLVKAKNKPSTKKAIVKKTTTKKVVKKIEIKPIEKDKKVIVNVEKKEDISKVVPIKRTRKSSKKTVITLPPPPKIDVSNYPKNKVKNILVSQPKPQETDKNPYLDLGKKYNLNVNFRQFIKVEGLSSQDFRLQRIEILAHGAVILTSKLSIIHYFRMCDEMRVTVPDSMKFFCINEQTAYYLQKYIQYRKRKIFFGHGTMLDLVDVIRKNKEEKFLLPVSDVHKEQIVEFLDELKINYTKGVFYKTVSADLSDVKNLNEFDLLVFFTPAGIKSLKQNFPNFKQGSTRIAAFGHTAALKLKEYGYRLDIFAPNPQNPSMTGAIETYLKESNKR
ncbi:MAG: uroporphyrinogen-III synthase [Bacteroidota bacterium]|nr:uroporphyrinogen-III synthase [Bacteroidota bacterium]